MGYMCKGLCGKYKPPIDTSFYKYKKGVKRCSICSVFVVWDGLWCPCCGVKLRVVPKNARYRRRITN